MSQQQAVLPYQRTTPLIDPESKFHACKTLRVLGPFCTVAGFGPGLGYLFFNWNMIAGREFWRMIAFAAVFGLLGASGVIYWLCAIYVRRNNRLAAKMALVLAWVHHGFFLFCFILSAVATFAGAWLALMPLVMSLLLMIGLLDLIRHLRRCVRSFRHLPHAA
jgi:hypothetical protein